MGGHHTGFMSLMLSKSSSLNSVGAILQVRKLRLTGAGQPVQGGQELGVPG